MLLQLAVMESQQAAVVSGSSFRVAGRSGSCGEAVLGIGYGC